MRLTDLLTSSSKAQLQSYYLHWFPGKEMLSVRERLAAELGEAMADRARVRQRFDTLPRAQQGFVIALLLRNGFSGTVAEVRAQKHGRSIEDFEVENVLKSLQEAGYIVRTSGTGGYANEVFTIPPELAEALRTTLAVEERQPLEMLSLLTHRLARGEEPGALPDVEDLEQRIGKLADPELRSLVSAALLEHGGILTRSAAGGGGNGGSVRLHRPGWRRELEDAGLGTTGILSLKDYGIDLEEEGLFIFQEAVYSASLRAAATPPDNDREICLGVDLIIDLDRALEVLRTEVLETTREGNVYKKIEERIAGQFVTAHHPEFHDGSPVGHIIELSRKLQFFDEEDQRITIDPLRRRVWRKKPILKKVEQVFEVYRSEKKGPRWSFHQTSIRESFLEHLKAAPPGKWLLARPFLTAVISRYLLRLEEDGVRAAYHERCTGDFRNETLVVSLSRLHHDLSYWVLHRMALLGIVDAGYRDGSFHSLRLSSLGMKLFGLEGRGDAGQAEKPRVLVNPDFEVLVYPDAAEDASWTLSLFADRLDSDRVKRYRITRESLKRGIVAGLSRQDMLHFLEANARGTVPPNVLFSLREWTDGVELVRLQKVHLLRAASAGGADRMASILEAKEIPFERLNETTVMVRGGKNERAVKALQQHFRDHGLFVE